MNKIICCFISILLFGCSSRNEFDIDLSKESEIIIDKPQSWTKKTKCLIEFKGHLNCNVKVYFSVFDSMELKKGYVDFQYGVEVVENEMALRIIPSNCNNKTNLRMKYSFSERYSGAK